MSWYGKYWLVVAQQNQDSYEFRNVLQSRTLKHEACSHKMHMKDKQIENYVTIARPALFLIVCSIILPLLTVFVEGGGGVS